MAAVLLLRRDLTHPPGDSNHIRSGGSQVSTNTMRKRK
jgi:hypothetical protein